MDTIAITVTICMSLCVPPCDILTSKGDDRMSSVKFKFDEKKIKRKILNQVKSNSLKIDVEVKCPHCSKKFTARKGTNICPYCNNEVLLNLEFDF